MASVSPSNDPPAVPAEFSQKALTMMVQVRELGRTVDGFRYAPNGRRLQIGTVASLPEEFLQLCAAALDVNPALGAGFDLTATEVREALSFKREFTNVISETRLVAKGMEDTVAERMSDVGERCLQFYNAVQRGNRGKAKSSSIVPHLAAMKRALGKVPRKKKAVPPDAPDAVKKGDAK
jgi:hypothetical protein